MRKPNWEALSTIAELIGAAGVVVSLVYVATEIRQNTRQVEEANRIERLAQLGGAFENFSRLRESAAESDDVARIWLSGVEAPGTLTAVERFRFEAMVGEMLNASQVLYARVEEGRLYPEVWGDLLLYLVPVVQRPGVAAIWQASKEGYRSEFVAALDGAIAESAVAGGEMADSVP